MTVINQPEKPVKTAILSEVMTPNMVNFMGNIHGGDLMSFLDKVAYVCSSRYAGAHVVTLSVDQIFFKEAIHVGEVITCYASINFVGKTSMEVGIRVEAENPITRIKRHTNTCYFTMVAVDESFHPQPVPPFKPETDEEKERYEAAKERRELRIKAHRKQK